MSALPYVRALALPIAGATLSWRHYQDLPVLTPALEPEDETAWPRVSIVVPARDEEGRLPALLDSLHALDYPAYETIVVDDNSGDNTAAVAAAGGARIVHGAALPAGWTGKSFACHQGAAAADGAWLLFADADTVHQPHSLRAAVAYARRHDLGALSLITAQRCETAAERLLLPIAYALLFAGLSPRRVNSRGTGRKNRRSPLANGQYMLYRRDAYERAGGHERVRASVIEDAALARALDEVGIRYRLCRGESMVSVRMYGGVGDIWAGFRKNAVRYVLDDPLRLPGVALHSATLSGTSPLLIQAAVTRRRLPLALALLAYATGAAGLIPWYRRFGVPIGYAAFYPIAATVFGLITLDSAWRLIGRRGARWKGRSYR